MKRLLLLFLLLGFTSSSWADPEKPSGNLLDLDPVEDNLPSQGDYEFIDLYNYSNFDKNQEKKKSINQGQIRKNGWQQKPTSIKKKPLNFKRK